MKNIKQDAIFGYLLSLHVFLFLTIFAAIMVDLIGLAFVLFKNSYYHNLFITGFYLALIAVLAQVIEYFISPPDNSFSVFGVNIVVFVTTIICIFLITIGYFFGFN